VHGFLETSTHKPHRYISRYHEIFEKKVAAYRPENTVLGKSEFFKLMMMTIYNDHNDNELQDHNSSTTGCFGCFNTQEI